MLHHLESVTSRMRKKSLVRGDGGVAGEGRVVGVPNIPFLQINY